MKARIILQTTVYWWLAEDTGQDFVLSALTRLRTKKHGAFQIAYLLYCKIFSATLKIGCFQSQNCCKWGGAKSLKKKRVQWILNMTFEDIPILSRPNYCNGQCKWVFKSWPGNDGQCVHKTNSHAGVTTDHWPLTTDHWPVTSPLNLFHHWIPP